MTRRLNDTTPEEWDEVARKWEDRQRQTDDNLYTEIRKRFKGEKGTVYNQRTTTNNTIM